MRRLDGLGEAKSRVTGESATVEAVKLLALTGGIGSGKSSVSQRFINNGFTVIDSDLVVRELQEPGRPVFVAMVERWGDRIVASDGTLDRQEVASIVFGDEAELEAINAMVHPAVRAQTKARIEELSSTDSVVVLDIPLLTETKNPHGASEVIVVDCPTEVAIDRLVEFRGFDRSDAEARMSAQASREERLALADFVIDNSGTTESLDEEVSRCLRWIDTLEPTVWPESPS